MRKFTVYSADRRIMIPLSSGSVFAEAPAGLGTAFSVTYKDGDRRRVIQTKKPNFEPIKLNLHFGVDGSEPRGAYRAFMAVFASLGAGEFLFEEAADGMKKTCFATLVKAPKTEIQKSGVITETFEFDRLSYWFREEKAEFTLESTDPERAGFPLAFPFAFSGVTLRRELTVQNDFFEPIPAKVVIEGLAESDGGCLTLTLVDRETESVISEIRLRRGVRAGETLTLDPETGKVVSEENGVKTDAYEITDKTRGTFLLIPPGSFLLRSDHRYADGGRIGIAFKRYLYD